MRRILPALVVCVACSSPAKPSVHEAVRVPAAVADVAPIVTPPALSAQSLVTASCANAPPDTDESHPLVSLPPRLDAGVGFYRVSGLAVAPRTTGDLPFELRLAAPATAASTTAPIALSLTFANTSRAPIALLRPLDGSAEHMRDPVYDLYLRDETSGDVYAWASHGARCGNLNTITASDYVTIAPNQTNSDVHRNGWAPYLDQVTIGRAGTYSLWVVYEECGREVAVLRTVSAGAHASNAIRVVVQ